MVILGDNGHWIVLFSFTLSLLKEKWSELKLQWNEEVAPKKKKKKVTWKKEIRTPISKKQNKLDCWTNSPELCSQYSWVLMSKF